MNRGPEIYDPDALKIESSRAERERMAGYANGRRRRGSGRKRTLRILLLDILILCIIGGVLYPFIVERNRAGSLGGTDCRLELRRSGEDVLVSLIMKTPEESQGNRPVDISLMVNGVTAKSFSDLTPLPGDLRTLRYRLEGESGKLNVKVVFESSEEQLRLNAVCAAE